MRGNIDVTFLSHHRKPKCAPNPKYPDGMKLDVSGGSPVACLVELPYPAECCGVLFVRCKSCGYSIAITTTGRVDDPRTIKVPCTKMA